MAEYIEREVAVSKMWMAQSSHHTLGERMSVNEAVAIVEEMPAADAVPVVRCKDCEHAERYERTDGTAGYYCGHPQNTFAYGERWDRVFKPAKEADDFCSYGARKENENG